MEGQKVRHSSVLEDEVIESLPSTFLAYNVGYLGRAHFVATKVLLSRRFDFVIGMVIIVNSILIGLEQTFEINAWDVTPFKILEHLFLCFYTGELLLRFFVCGLRALKDHWVKFDVFLVVVSSITTWILPQFINPTELEDIAPVMVMRTARLARLARALRLLIRFRELWMLVRGLILSANMMIYTMVLLIIILYLFTTVGVELITLSSKKGYPDNEFKRIVESYFPTVPITMLTLVQFVCMDSIGQIYRPLIKSNPFLVVYFTGVILVVGIVLMNIITAVLVNGALEQANQDKEMMRAHEKTKKERLSKDLLEMFRRLDKDNSGVVDRDEVLNASEEDKALLNEFMELKDPLEVFNQLDIDDGGTLSIEEFVEGLYECAVSKNPIELKRMDKRMDAMNQKTDILISEIRKMQEAVLALCDHAHLLRGDSFDWEPISLQKQEGGIPARPVAWPHVRASVDHNTPLEWPLQMDIEKQSREPWPHDTPDWAKQVVIEVRRLRSAGPWHRLEACNAPVALQSPQHPICTNRTVSPPSGICSEREVKFDIPLPPVVEAPTASDTSSLQYIEGDSTLAGYADIPSSPRPAKQNIGGPVYLRASG